MILSNAKVRLNDAIEKANSTNEEQSVSFLYNELLTYDTITSVFDWLFREAVDFETRRCEYRFLIIIKPKKIN